MTNPPNKSEHWKELAILAQGGDKRAYAELLRDIVPSIKAALAGKINTQDAIEDITQEVLVSVHKSLHTYDSTYSFRSWLMAITNFRRTDYLRSYYRDKNRKEAIESDGLFQDSLVTKPVAAGELKDIEAALNDISDAQRKIFTLLKIEGHSVAEVAQEMDMNESAVKVSAHRTMKKLQERLS